MSNRYPRLITITGDFAGVAPRAAELAAALAPISRIVEVNLRHHFEFKGCRKFMRQPSSNTRCLTADEPQFEPRKPSDFFYFPQDVADPQRTMVRRPFAAPSVDEGRGFKAKSQPAIRVADSQPLPGQRFAFSR
jgi:hypothetical protein